MNRCRPGSRSCGVAQDALRVTVLARRGHVDQLETRPGRWPIAPTFVISANSSDADAPPVCTSETRRVETGHVTAPRALRHVISRRTDGHAGERQHDEQRSKGRNASLHDRPPGGSHRGRAGRLGRCSRGRSTAAHRGITRRSPAAHRRDDPRLHRRSPADHPGRASAYDSRARPRCPGRTTRRRQRGPRQADRSIRGPPAVPPGREPGRRHRRSSTSSRTRRRSRSAASRRPRERLAQPQPAGRPGITASFRAAYRPANIREDLGDAPEAAPALGLPRPDRDDHRRGVVAFDVLELHRRPARLADPRLPGLGLRAAAARRRLLRAASELPARASS